MRAGRKPRRFAGAPRRRVLAWEVPVATTRTARLLGLALLSRERAGAGLLIPRCRSVHTFGMRFELDLLFLDGTGTVVDLRRGVRPGRIAGCRGAAAVLELPSPWALLDASSSPRYSLTQSTNEPDEHSR